jgi:hypothetical protein
MLHLAEICQKFLRIEDIHGLGSNFFDPNYPSDSPRISPAKITSAASYLEDAYFTASLATRCNSFVHH